MKFHCGQMWITYISDYGSVERWRNRKTDVNHFANLRNAVYTRSSINISVAENKSVQQHRKWHRLQREYRYDSLGMSYPRVYWSFYGKDLKKTIYSEICRLYVSLEHTSEKRRHAFHHLFSPCDFLRTLLSLLVPLAVHIHWEYLFLLQSIQLSRSWVNRFLVTLARIDSDTFWNFQKLINEKFQLFPLFSSDSARFSNV